LNSTVELMADAGLESEADAEYDAATGCFADTYAALLPLAFHLKGHFPVGCLQEVVGALGQLFAHAPVLLDLGCGMLMTGSDALGDDDWERICATAAAHGGHVLLERAPRSFKANHDVFGPHRSEWQVMHRIKAALDPKGIFSPGTLPGKI